MTVANVLGGALGVTGGSRVISTVGSVMSSGLLLYLTIKVSWGLRSLLVMFLYRGLRIFGLSAMGILLLVFRYFLCLKTRNPIIHSMLATVKITPPVINPLVSGMSQVVSTHFDIEFAATRFSADNVGLDTPNLCNSLSSCEMIVAGTPNICSGCQSQLKRMVSEGILIDMSEYTTCSRKMARHPGGSWNCCAPRAKCFSML